MDEMATVISLTETGENIQLGSGENKSARIPRGLDLSVGDKVLVSKVSGKYLIINAY